MTQATSDRLTDSVADEIRSLIARRRLSAAKLAQELGWSQPYMARRMTGAQSFDLNDLQQLARALHVKVSELIAHAEDGDGRYTPVTREYLLEPAKAPAPVASTAVPKIAARFATATVPPNGSRRTAPTGL